MSRRITRKTGTARKSAASQGKARRVRKARKQTGSFLGSALAMLPISEEQLHRVFLAIILGGAVALAWVVASMAGVPAMAHRQLATVAGDAGFEVRRVDVRGVENINELKIYERVLAERDQAMPLVDIEALRRELLELPWIKDARVSRQLPDTLVIDIVERKPHAVMRRADKLVLIDKGGHALETISADAAKGMLMVSGPGVSEQIEELAHLLDAAPALKPQVREAEWIGNRRWNLTFQTDQVLALPEGEDKAAGALVNFASLDGTNRLLGGKVAAFDMRAGDRIYMRVPDREGRGELLQAGATASAESAE